MERKTIENDEEYLRQVSKEVSFDDESLKDDIEEIERFCKIILITLDMSEE